jgi:glyoxylase-like metal-dependent hydrolase (beta-lactamase superfamily II)
MQVSPSVRAVQVPDENPMHPQVTTIYLVGQGQVLTVDSGEALERYQWMLRGYLAAIEKAEVALAAITHHHLDHSGNLKWIRELYKADVLVHDQGVPLLEDKLPDEGVSTVREGKAIDLGSGVRVQVLETPGHSVDSVCYYLEEEGVLFSGDTLLGSSTTTVWSLGPYMASLERLLTLPNLKVICPGHGPIVNDPRERLQQYIDHRNMRERQILEQLGQGDAQTSWDIMLKLYPDIDTRLRRAANNNVETHLRKLQDEGRLIAHGGVPKEKSDEERLKAEEHARERREVIDKGKQYEKEDRAAALAAQENPPTDLWEVMPSYELVGRPNE